MGALVAVFAAAAGSGGGCGARSPLDVPPPGPPAPECFVDADCPGYGDLCNPVRCRTEEEGEGGAGGAGGGRDAGPPAGVCVPLQPVDCDDGDVCTIDTCDPTTGACSHGPATLDSDGDGHRAPRQGTKPGDVDACGDDCDDASPLAHPGGIESCDGVDNDCNGVVDDNASFIPLATEIRVSGDIAPASPGGLAWSGTSYAAMYTGDVQGFEMYSSMLGADGQKLDPPGERRVTFKNADGMGGPIVWTGDRYGLSWQDRRDGDYEVYFTLLKPDGSKAIADQRLSTAQGFSINVALTWNGAEFVAVWQDARDDIFNLFAQRISVDGVPVGGNVALTTDAFGWGNEAPAVASGVRGLGVAWASGDTASRVIRFRTFDGQLAPVSTQLELTDGTTEAVFPTVVWNKDRYVVAWFDKSASPKGIYAAAVAEDGTVLVPPTAVSSPGMFRSRYPFLRPLGDRVLVVYADDRDQNDGYELYARMVSADLSPMGPEQRLTHAPGNSIYPLAAFGRDGDVGILFRDDREGEHHVYFTRLGCVAGP